VINVSWEGAQEYVRWLSARTGDEYRLPSEAEWEYAARAGTTTRYSWGDDIGHDNANCDGCGSLWDDEQTAPVGSFSANALGLHDIHGNVSEWVEDCWSDSYDGAPSNGGARVSGDCSLRVVRGGSWYYGPGYVRSAERTTILD
jgi:formylglycine-generating enzyme required for sulfatase activity